MGIVGSAEVKESAEPGLLAKGNAAAYLGASAFSRFGSGFGTKWHDLRILPFLFWAKFNEVFNIENFIGGARAPCDIDLDGVKTELLQLANRLLRPGYGDSHFKWNR
jgi:hypothetical protein